MWAVRPAHLVSLWVEVEPGDPGIAGLPEADELLGPVPLEHSHTAILRPGHIWSTQRFTNQLPERTSPASSVQSPQIEPKPIQMTTHRTKQLITDTVPRISYSNGRENETASQNTGNTVESVTPLAKSTSKDTTHHVSLYYGYLAFRNKRHF